MISSSKKDKLSKEELKKEASRLGISVDELNKHHKKASKGDSSTSPCQTCTR